MTRPVTLGGPALLLAGPDRLAAGGCSPAELLDRVERVGLRGRGGAGFPMAAKLRTVAAQAGVPVVVANGEEGEPGSVKDRHLLRTRPGLVIDGLARAAAIVGAERGYVYLSDPLAADAVRAELAAHPPALPVTVALVDPAYVAGEETAVVRYLNGGPALPVAKPPRPYEIGVGGAPTLVSNVETLAHLALLAHDPAGAADRVLVTVTGRGLEPVLIEAPATTTLAEVAYAAGCTDATGALMGGMFGGFLRFDAMDPARTRINRESPAATGTALGNGGPHRLDSVDPAPTRIDRESPAATGTALGNGGPHRLDSVDPARTRIDRESLAAAGTSLGNGVLHLLRPGDCPIDVAADALDYLAEESSRQCGVCVAGTRSLAGTMTAVRAGTAGSTDHANLARWSGTLPGRGACGLLDAAARIAGSLLDRHGEAVTGHLGTACPSCADSERAAGKRFAAAPPR